MVIDSIEYPLDYWVEWVVDSIYDRAIEEDEYGEIWIRFYPRISLSSDKGWYRVVLP